MKTITLPELIAEYNEIQNKVPSYRLGQHFINRCIKIESDSLLDGLWDEENFTSAKSRIIDVCAAYHWYDKGQYIMPYLKGDKCT